VESGMMREGARLRPKGQVGRSELNFSREIDWRSRRCQSSRRHPGGFERSASSSADSLVVATRS
jgi:hypothetical protein